VRFQAVIFDLDGTLADSLRDLGEAMNRALADAGKPTHPLEAYRHFVGEGVDVMVARAAAPEVRPEVLRGIIDGYRRHYGLIDHAHTQPYEGIPALLDALTAAKVPMAVLSNKRDDFTKLLVKQRFGSWRFAEVRGEREGVPRKPDPTAAFEVALALNVLPANICFVGDTAIDMKTAVNAGMQRVGCSWGFRDRAELLGAGAQRVIAHPMELLAG
jgi:phosphoglycolate phosphatase